MSRFKQSPTLYVDDLPTRAEAYVHDEYPASDHLRFHLSVPLADSVLDIFANDPAHVVAFAEAIRDAALNPRLISRLAEVAS